MFFCFFWQYKVKVVQMGGKKMMIKFFNKIITTANVHFLALDNIIC